MMYQYHSGSFPYGDPAYGHHSGYAGQYDAPDAKRFRHEKWNGMRGNFRFPHNSQHLHSAPRPSSGVYNPQQFGTPYSFGQQSIRHGFEFGQEFMSFPANQCMNSHVSHFHAARPGYSHTSKHLKRGNGYGSKFTNKSDSDLKGKILQKLAASRKDGFEVCELVRILSCPKKNVNRVLYSMQREGLVDKISEQPPRWVLKTQQNVYSAHNSGFNSLRRSSEVVNSLTRSVSSQSVVPIGVNAVKDEPTFSGTSESFDIIPAAAISDTNVPAMVDYHTFALSSCGLMPPQTAADAENMSLGSSTQDVHQQEISRPTVSLTSSSATVSSADTSHVSTEISGLDESSQMFVESRKPAGRGCGANEVMTCSVKNAGQVHQQDSFHTTGLLITASDSLTSTIVTVSSADTSDVSRQKPSLGDSSQTFVELRKSAGRGRGVLLLRDRLVGTVGSSFMSASSQSKCHQTPLDAEQFSDSGQIDSSLKPNDSKPLPVTDISSQAGIVDISGTMKAMISQPTVRSEPTLRDIMCVASSEVSSGLGVDQSVGKFKPPLPPKQLVRADATYKAAMSHEVKLHSMDDTNMLSYGMHPGSSFTLNRESSSAESESYKSLPDSLIALSFRPSSSLPSARSLDDLRDSCMPMHNPFAAALGIEDTSGVDDVSPGQMPEGAGALSLTGESFAALNKNSVSALMEYAQSRHVDVEVKCIGSFGPPHRPVCVSLYVSLSLCVCVFEINRILAVAKF